MTYVMSDIHGNMRRFQSIMKQIKLQPEDTLYVLGDVIDRYPDGGRILIKLMDMPNVHMLLGNHEYMMLDVFDSPAPQDYEEYYLQTEKTTLWYQNGGRVTHEYFKHIRKDLRARVFAYLRALPLQADIEIGGVRYHLTHGGDLNEHERHKWRFPDEKYYAVWYRRTADEIPPKDYTVIFGHTPTGHYQKDQVLRIWHGDHQIGIDCGSGYPDAADRWGFLYYGRLACLRLDDMKEFYSEEPYGEIAS